MTVWLAGRIVRGAARLVPQPKRAAFRAQWDAEWAHAAPLLGPWARLRWAWGAWADARTLRALARPASTPSTSTRAVPMTTLVRELWFAVRNLARQPGYTAVVVATLALGLGASAAVFTLLDRVVLDPLPYPASERLVRLKNAVPGVGPDTEWQLAAAQFFYYGEHVDAIESIGAYQRSSANVVTATGAQRARTAMVSASLQALIGARAHVGRLIDETDQRREAPRVVVLGHGFWTRQFGADPAVVGQTITIAGAPVVVVGVMALAVSLPPESGGPSPRADLWLPMRTLDPAGPFFNNHVIPAIAKLRPGITPGEVERQLERLLPQLPEAFPNVYDQAFFDRYGFRTVVHPLREYVVGGVARHLWVLTGAVALVLLVAAANIANLLAVRLDGRRGELAVRTALGASRSVLAWTVGAEVVVLAVVGGALGVVGGWLGLNALLSLAPDALPRYEGLALDGTMVGVALLLSLATAAGIVGIGMWQQDGSGLAQALRDGGRRATSSRPRHRVRSGLVVGQVALAMTLTVGAGLLVSSLRRLRQVDPGVRPDGVLLVDLDLEEERYRSYDAMWGFHRSVLDGVRGLPSVTAAGFSSDIPLEGGFGCTVQAFDDQAVYDRVRAAGMTMCAGQEPTTPGYFEALGIPIRHGRSLIRADVDGPVAGAVVVSEAFAARFWPGEEPLGKAVAPAGRSQGPFYRVVGVAGDVPAATLGGEPAVAIYYPTRPIPESGGIWMGQMTLAVRVASGDPLNLLPAVREELRRVDPAIPMANARTMAAVVDRSTGRLLFTTLLLEVAAGASLLLAALGLYGVLSYLVSRSRREIGMRIAIGAEPSRVERLIVFRSLRLVGWGLGLGLGVAWALSGAVRGLLYGVAPTHPTAFVLGALILLLVGGLASWLPARRAAGVDPAEVLRS